MTSAEFGFQTLTSAHRLGERHEVGRFPKTVRRHVAVDRLVLSRSDEVRLVPDAATPTLADALPEVAPDVEVNATLPPKAPLTTAISSLPSALKSPEATEAGKPTW